MKLTAPVRLLVLMVGLAAWSVDAVADCSNPSAPEGALDYSYTAHAFKYCDNTNTWQTVGSGGGGGSTDRIVSGTTSVVAVSNTGLVQINTSGVNTGYFDGAGRLVVPGVSVTTIHGISSTNGFFSNKIGIGTEPVYPITLSATNAQLKMYSAGGTYSSYVGQLSNGNVYVWNESAGNLLVGTNNAERLRVDSAGNVGIGTSSPKAKLDVVGTISATNAIQVGTSSLACSGGIAGAIRYSATSGTIEVCNGSVWNGLAAGGVSGTVAFTVAATADQTVAAGGIIDWGVNVTSAGSSFDLTNDRFVAPVAGYYFFQADLLNGNDNTRVDGRLYKNGNNTGISSYAVADSVAYYRQGTLSGVVYLAAGDYVDIRGSGAFTLYGSAGAFHSRFSGFLISPGVGGGGGGGASALNDLTDVNTSGAAAGKVLRYDGSSWVVSDTGGGSLATLTDVSASSPADGGILRYNNSSSKWESVDVSSAMSTTTMVTNWPDAIRCSDASSYKILYFITGPNTGLYYYRYVASPTGTADLLVTFGGDGSFSALTNMTSSDCDGKSISQLYASGQAFNFIGGSSGSSNALGDRITSGTLAMTVDSVGGLVSLSTSGVAWGYLGSAASYLPNVTTNKVSSTYISGTYVQFASATTVLSCGSALEGTMRYTSGTMQVCDGSNWGNIGIGVPTGTIAAFAASSCPSGWSEYTAARGRFLRGIDNGAGNDPDGTRSAGGTQGDGAPDISGEVLVGTSHVYNASGVFSESANPLAARANNLGPSSSGRIDFKASNSNAKYGAANEIRPKNVAVTFCQYNGFESALSAGVATLASLSDVSVGGATSGQALVFDGASWVPSTTTGGASPAGASRDVQFNSSGALAADTGRFTYSGGVLTAPNISSSGVVQVSGSSPVCGGSIKGAMRYSNTSSTIEYCQGTAWVSMGPSATDVPAFSVHKNGTSQTMTNNVYDKLTWSHELFDTYGDFNVGTGRFQPSVGGYYLIHGQVYCAPMTGCSAQIQKSGSGYKRGYSEGASGGVDFANVTAVVYLNGSTDYVELWGRTTGGTSINGSPSDTYFEGTLIASGNGLAGGGGASALNDLTDVNTSGAVAGKVLRYDGSSWVVSDSVGTGSVWTTSGTDIYSSNSGAVGIGTANPTRKLHVQSAAQVVGLLQSTNTGGARLRMIDGNNTDETVGGEIAVLNRDMTLSTNATERMRITSAGNVGIGVTGPNYLLHVSGTGPVGFFGNANLVDQYIAFRSTTTGMMVGLDGDSPDANGAGRIQSGASKALIFDAGNSTYGNGNGDMVITSAGNVGIGTASPAGQLHVASGGNTVAVFEGGASNHSVVQFTNGVTSRGYVGFANTGSTGLGLFNASGTTVNMLVTNGGSVGIGTTSPNTSGAGSLHIRNGGDSGESFSNVTGLLVENNGLSPGWYAFQVATAGGGKSFSVQNDGKVGIGTTNPQAKLQVHSTSGNADAMIATDATSDAILALSTDEDGSSREARIGFDYSENVVKMVHGTSFAGSSNGVVVNSSGNVGIGTTSPKAKLDVVGTISASDAVQVGSSSLTCNASISGAMRYTSGTMQVCNGSSWGNVGIGVPTGTIAAFPQSSCPSGWNEYTQARGRFLRGIDTLGSGIDPSGTRAAGSVQDDAVQNATGMVATQLYDENDDGSSSTGVFQSSLVARRSAPGGGTGLSRNTIDFDLSRQIRTSTETRPKNVAVIFCQYAGFASALSGAEGIYWDAGGQRLGVGTTSPDQGKIEVKGGSVCVDTNNDNNATSCIANESDARLKTNVKALEGSLERIVALRGVSFDWRVSDTEVLKHYPLLARFAKRPHSVGLIAQEVQKVLPEAIEEETVGDKEVQYMQLDYTKLVPLLIEGVKELKVANDVLVSRTIAAEQALKAANDNYQELRREVEALKAAR